MIKRFVPLVLVILMTLSSCSLLSDILDEETESNIDTGSYDFSGYGFYYNQLDDYVKDIYLKLYEGLENFEEVVELSMEEEQDVDMAIYALGCDHPEFFWLSETVNYDYTDDAVSEVSFDIPKNAKKTSEKISSIADDILSDMPSSDDYEKYKYLYEWIINNVEYKEGKRDQDIRSVFLEHESVCAGYSCAFQYLCGLAGLPCTDISGTVTDNESHAWNLVILDDDYYWVDVTWGDPVYDDEEEAGGSDDADDESEEEIFDNSIDYDFFLVSDDVLLRSHTIDNEEYSGDYYLGKDAFSFPKCTSDKYNYYVLNGCRFDTYDQSEIDSFVTDMLESDSESGLVHIEMQFIGEDDWNNAYDDLISDEDESHIDDVIDEFFTNSEEPYSYESDKFYSEESLTFEIYVAVYPV